MNIICASAAHCESCRARPSELNAHLHDLIRRIDGEAIRPDGSCGYGVPIGVKKGEANPVDRRVVYATPAIDRAAVEAVAWLAKGPEFWAELHGKADPTGEWFADWLRRIHCPKCRWHFTGWLKAHPPDFGSLAAYRRWTWEAHNAVNRHLVKPEMAWEAACERWGWAGPESPSPPATAPIPSSGALFEFFDRVVLINLDRRPDRLEETLAHLQHEQWPFRWPQRFPAVDGLAAGKPKNGTRLGAGAYGCHQSHEAILRAADAAGESVLILEDDVMLRGDGRPGLPQLTFAQAAASFLARVPADWEGINFGGSHIGIKATIDSKTRPWIVQSKEQHRTQMHALRGAWLKAVIAKLAAEPGHVDHLIGPMMENFKIYAPRPSLAGQRKSFSDIMGKVEGGRFFD